VYDIKPRQRPARFDRDDRMRRAMPDCSDNVGNRAQKPLDLVRIELQRRDQVQL
jgi:hypothetical protein